MFHTLKKNLWKEELVGRQRILYATSLKTFSCLVLQGRDPKFLAKYPSKWWIFHGYVRLPECNPGNPANQSTLVTTNPKESWPTEWRSTPEDSIQKIDKNPCFFWCQKNWEAKKLPSIKNIETIWVVSTYGPKNAIVVFCCAPCPARAVTAEEVVKICLTFMWIIWGH